jgi:hypothetical protein
VRPARSLESKWGTVKHDVARFVGVYKQVFDTKESGTTLDDVLWDALELYKVRDPKQHSFVYLHCWIILRDIPCWMDSLPETQLRQPGRAPASSNRSHRSSTPSQVEDDEVAPLSLQLGNDITQAAPVPSQSVGSASGRAKRFQRLQGSKAAKEDQQNVKTKESAVWAQARAASEMAAANFKKAQALENQQALSLFTLPQDWELDAEVVEFVKLRRREEMLKTRWQLAVEEAALAKLTRDEAREQAEHDQQLRRTTASRVLPAPLRQRKEAPPAAPVAPALAVASPSSTSSGDDLNSAGVHSPLSPSSPQVPPLVPASSPSPGPRSAPSPPHQGAPLPAPTSNEADDEIGEFGTQFPPCNSQLRSPLPQFGVGFVEFEAAGESDSLSFSQGPNLEFGQLFVTLANRNLGQFDLLRQRTPPHSLPTGNFGLGVTFAQGLYTEIGSFRETGGGRRGASGGIGGSGGQNSWRPFSNHTLTSPRQFRQPQFGHDSGGFMGALGSHGGGGQRSNGTSNFRSFLSVQEGADQPGEGQAQPHIASRGHYKNL